MKLDSEPQQFSPLKEHITKIVGCNGNHASEILMFGEDVRSESICNYISLAEYLSREKALESSHQASGKDMGGSLTDNHTEGVNMVATSYVPLPEFEMVREKSEAHAERPVVEIEQSKVIVCFERDEKHAIMDIGIDKGMHSSDSVLPHKDKEERLDFLTVFSNDEKCIDASNGIHDSNGLQSSFLNSNPFLNDDKEAGIPNFTACMREDTDTSGIVDKSLDNLSNKEVKGLIFLVDQELGRNSLEVHSSDIDCDEHGARSMALDNIQPLNSCSSDPLDSPNQGTLELENSSTSAAGHVGEPEHVEGSADFSSFDKENVGAILTSDADMPLTIASKEMNHIPGLHPHDQSMIGEMPNDNLPTASRNPFLHYSHTDASVFGPHSLSDRISYTGHVPNSGSISIRSDSSTTSTRSFAFPILQSEWNSSPVKMAKADRRRYKKYCWWRSHLLCCRF